LIFAQWPGLCGEPTLAAMTHVRQIVGAFGECMATRYLIAQGMVLLDRNWRTVAGEIDLILRDRRDLVFCEVKTRRTLRFGVPVEAIVPGKVRRMRRLAAQWLAVAGARPGEVRFDVLSVLRHGERVRVEHLRRAF
jgi:putative endonuclease